MATTKTNKSVNHIFILELRVEQDTISGKWDPLRIILKNPKTGDRYGFQSFVQLHTFLAACLPFPTEES
jgi:hypothetical protein